MKYIITIISLMFSSLVIAQDVNMQTGTVNQCSGVFYDSGGEFGNYGNDEDFTLTICPENPGQKVQLDFTEFNTQLNQDEMTIFNGDSTAEPQFGIFSGGTGPGMVEATQDNTSGCITIQYTSNGSGNASGWAATISCLTPCQTINSQIDTASPAPNGDGYIRVCPNEDITLTGSGTFSVDGTGATYEWDLGDGNTIAGQTATFSYPTPGVYIVNLNINDANTSQDPEGCSNNNLINQVIQVATEPDFTGTAAAQSTLCFGETTTIDGVVAPTEFINDCTPPVSGVTFLPDGNGVTYETSVTVDCYDSAQTLTDVNQLVSICLNMEHSYLGDLDIEIISPNGQTVRMHDQGGGSANLGEPWATGGVDGNSANTTPGIGYDYCFVPNGGFPTLVGGVQTGGTFTNGDGPGTYTDSFVPAGSYSSVNPLNGLLGSPLNGDWTIRVVDNIGLDNGHIFSWSIEFDPNLQPPELSFTPTITSEAWDPDPTITNTTGNVITVEPPTAGQFCYTYRVTDDFGCEYTEQVCIDVLPEIVTEAPNNLFVCDTGSPPYIFDLETNTAVVTASATNATDLVVTYHNSQPDADADTGVITGLNNYSGTDGEIIYIRVEYLNSGCYEVLPFTLNVAGQPDINPVPDLVLCDDASNDGFEEFDLSTQTAGILGPQAASDFNVTYHLSFADADANTGSLVLNYTNTVNPQPIYVRIESVGDSNCYNASANPVFNLIVDPRDDASFNVTPTCDGATATITGATGGTFTFNPAPTDSAVIDPNTGLITGGTSGATYTIEYTTNGTCPATSAQTFSVITEDDPSFTVTPNCDGGTVTITGDMGGTFSFNPPPTDAAMIDPNTGEVTNATPGDSYTIEYVTSGICPSSSTQVLNVLTLGDPSFTLTATCDGATANITGDVGGTFAFNPIPADTAIIDANTGTVTNGVSGSTYTVEYTTAGNCPQSSTQNVTVITADDASFTVTPTCDGGTVTITGTTGGTFSFDVVPTDVAVIDPNTGDVTNGTPGAQYSISYTTGGTCSDAEVVSFNALPIDDASFTVDATCDGGIVTITGTTGGTFSFNPAPADAAVIDTNTGNVTNGSPGETYSIEYVTSGACPNGNIVQFTAHPLPTLVAPTPLEVCDDGVPDGLTEIDLGIKNAEISGGNPGYTVSYYLDQSDADTATDPLPIPYTNISNPQTVFVRVEDNGTGCYDTVTLDLVVEQAPIANTPEPLRYCDPDNDGFGTFTLTDADDGITGGAPGLTVSYHETLANAQNDADAIDTGVDYNNIVVNMQTLYARVESGTIATDCATIVELQLIVEPSPQIEDPTPLEECDDISADGYATFDLTSKDAEILDGLDAMQYTVTYYETEADANAPNNAIANPNAYTNTVEDSQFIWVRVEDTNTVEGCYKVTTLELIVVPSPEVPTDIAPLVICDDDDDGTAQFDLTERDADILGAQNPADVVLTYHVTAADAQVGNNPIINVGNYTNTANPQTIYVRLFNPTTGCQDTGEFELQVQLPPEPVQPTPLEECDDLGESPGDEMTEFDLTVKDAEITDGNGSWSVTYYETNADAQAGMNAIPDPTQYTNTSVNGLPANPQTLYIVVTDTDTGCVAYTTMTIRVLPNPTPTPSDQLPDLELCDDINTGDGVEEFDLTANEILILNGEAGVTPTYHETAEDADTGDNPIVDPTAYTNIETPEQEIYVRVTNDATGCYTFVDFTIRVNPLPEVVAVTDFIQCELNTDGFDSFDLTTKDAEVLNGQSPTQYTVTYHDNVADAEAVMNALVSPYTNTSNPQQIFVAITDTTTGCSISTQSFNLQVDEAAQANPDMGNIVYEECDDNMETDGDPSNDSVQFDLSIQDAQVLDGQDPADYIVSYYATEADANLNVNPLPNLYENITNPQVIYARVDNNTLTVVPIALDLTALTTGLDLDADGTVDTYDTDADGTFDLIDVDGDGLSDGIDNNADGLFEFVDVDGDGVGDPVDLNNDGTFDNQQDGSICFAVAPLTLQVNPLPEFDLDDSYVLCINTNGTEVLDVPVLDTGLSDTDYSFEWSYNGTVLPGETGSTLTPTQGGTYSVTVTDTSTSTATSCTNTDSAEVIESEPPMLTAEVVTQAFGNNNVIEAVATGIGDYEYSLDGGPWQDSGIFDNVSQGDHVITARDRIGCGLTTVTVFVLDYPKYFTPNGDGNNDTWNIEGIGNGAKIYIFDRYGKLLKQLSPSGSGWDGTFNGNMMPTSDYWFTIEYDEPTNGQRKEFRAHFTLKR